MKASIVFAALTAAILTMQGAVAADRNDRPSGVEAGNWVSISDTLGFVIVVKKEVPVMGGSREILIADTESISAELLPPKKGYFVIKTKTGWQPLVISEPTELGG